MGRFYLKKFIHGVAYERIKLKDGKDAEIYENFGFVQYDWHDLGDPTTFKKESWRTFEKLVGWD